MPHPLKPRWDRTVCLEERLENELVDGLFEGRSLIKRDSPIEGGVYLGQGQREAVVVDTSRAPQLERCYQKARQSVALSFSWGFVPPSSLLYSVYRTVQAVMQYDEHRTKALLRKLDAQHDQKISLGVFVKAGYGVCRHTALLAAYLLERFQKDGHLPGQISVDRNTVLSSGHAWCRYTSPEGLVYILDPAQKKFGLLEDIRKEKGSWFYKRETD